MDNYLGLTQAYKFYKTKVNYAQEYQVSLQEYRDICKEFNQMVVEEVLEGKNFKIPFQLGNLWIKKYPINWNKPPLDIKETCLQRKRVYHTNQHSDEFYAGWKWSRVAKSTTNCIFYSFKPAWTNVKRVSQIMFQPGGHKRFFTEQKL